MDCSLLSTCLASKHRFPWGLKRQCEDISMDRWMPGALSSCIFAKRHICGVDIYNFSIFMEKKHLELKEQSHVCKWHTELSNCFDEKYLQGLWHQRLACCYSASISVISQRFSGEHVGLWRLIPTAGTARILGLCEECILWEQTLSMWRC